MRVSRKALVILTALLVSTWIATLSAEALAEERSFTFRADTPAVEILPQAAEDPFVDVRISGFEVRSTSAGAPDIPTRSVLVAIPPGAVPRLSVRQLGPRKQIDRLPRPVPRVLRGVSSFDRAEAGESKPEGLPVTRKFYRAADEHYRGAGVSPPEAAWLGGTGTLRGQRYVQVHLAPVRFDAAQGAVLIDPALELTVHFDGDFDLAVTPETEDPFEAVYRNNFVNYAQGTRFRLGGLQADGRDRGFSRRPRSTSAPLPSGPRYRILIDEAGPLRLDHARIAADAPEFLAHDPANWRLTNRGETVPLQIHQEPGDDAVFEANEWVLFYGQIVDDEPETVLSVPAAQSINDLYEVRDFTDVNTYFLYVDTDPQPAMSERDALPSGATPEPDFPAVARVEVDDNFLPLAEELWFWSPFTSAGGAARTETVSLPGLATGTLPAQFRVRLRGFGECIDIDPDHESRVTVQNDLAQPLGNQNVGQFDGNSVFEHDFGWTHSGADPELTNPVHIELEAPVLACLGGNYGFFYSNDLLLDSIEVEYRRTFDTDDDHLTFQYPDGDFDFEITGFGSDVVEVYEITDTIGASGVVETVRLTDVSVVDAGLTNTVSFRIDDTGLPPGSLRSFVVVGLGAIPVLASADLSQDRVSTLQTDTTHADMIVVAHPDLLDSECSEGNNPCSYDVDCVLSATDVCEILPGSALGQLLAWRAGQGVDSRVVRIQDVEDEFNDGLPGPLAIEQFVSWVYLGGWAGDPPAYLMLLGDGSYDYKAGTAGGSYVPTQVVIRDSLILGHFSSDNTMTAVAGGDFTPDLLAGRISTRTLEETEGVLQKILDAEQTPPAGDWSSSFLFMSDRDHSLCSPDTAVVFEQINDLGAQSEFLLDHQGDPTPYSTEHLRYWSDYCPQDCSPCDKAGMRQAIKDRVNAVVGDGVAIAQFAGHGNEILWSDDVLVCTDEASPFCTGGAVSADDLQNDLKLPMLVVHNCLSGAFHKPTAKSLGEEWLKRIPDGEQPLAGGAASVWAPSGLGFPTYGFQLTEKMFEDVLGPRKERQVAVPVLDGLVTLCTLGGDAAVEPCQYYVLLGDPSSRLALPHVGPATNVAATASTEITAFVDLSWDASSTPGAIYDVYRRDVFSGTTYAKITPDCDPGPCLTETSFHDDDVEHTKLYYYFVIARDNQGFESAWSNFNSDCGEEPETDCVQATPTNTIAPVGPSGLVVTDAETGGRLDLTWNPNPEPDILSYTLHYGLTSSYGQTKTVLITPYTTLSGLENGQPYFFAVQATNTSGLTGPLTDPAVSATPSLVVGVKAPGFIDDLMLDKSGQDAVLTWGPVTEDIYGKPTTVDFYEVYRGTSPQFDPLLSAPIGTPSDTTFTDPLALAPGAPDYHYLVRAVDLSGNPGGVGRQLPSGVLDLIVEPGTGTKLLLSWSPVTLDFDDEPTQIDHYELYAEDEAFTREEIRDGQVTATVPVVPGESIEIEPLGPNRYYSVLAVDVRGNRSPF